MANNGFHQAQDRKPTFNFSSATSSINSTPLELSPELPAFPQPPLFHTQEQATNIKFPPGFRFVPTDIELIVDYLERKLKNLPLPMNLITEANLYDHHPQELIEQHKHKIQQNYLYLFTPRDKKYKNGKRPNRAISNGIGYWKATGADTQIKNKGRVVGYRKSLVYYAGKPPRGQKTNWFMQKFRLKDSPEPTTSPTNDMKLDDWVLCRVQGKNRHATKIQAEDAISNIVCPDDVEMNNMNGNNLMITRFDFPISTDGYNVEEMMSNDQLESLQFGSYGNLSSWPLITTGEENQFSSSNVDDMLFTRRFDHMDASSFMSLPDSDLLPFHLPDTDLPPFPPSEFGGK